MVVGKREREGKMKDKQASVEDKGLKLIVKCWKRRKRKGGSQRGGGTDRNRVQCGQRSCQELQELHWNID